MYKTENDGTTNKEQFFSIVLYLNKEYSDNLFNNISLIKYESFDDNNNGLIDRFKFKIIFKQNNVKNLKNIKMVFLFSYE